MRRMATDSMTVKISPNDKGNPVGKLADAVTAGHAVRAFLVLGGDGWKLRDYFTSGKLSEHLIHAALIRVVILGRSSDSHTTGTFDRSDVHSCCLRLTPGQLAASRPPP